MSQEQASNAPALSVEEKQKALVERARKGVLKFLRDKGGQLPLSEMHDFSLNTYLIQHQAFSQLMESLVNDGLVDFSHEDYKATITDAGKTYIST